MTINEQFRKIIAENEGGPEVALEFSDPDGVRSGKSGWSFGVCQFDVQNNSQALACLSECGFTHDEIDGIVHQTIDVHKLEYKLKENAEVIARYDDAQLQHCLNAAGRFLENYGIAVQDDAAFLMLADTVNQYGSLGSGTAAGCRMFGRPVTAEDLLNIKLQWKYSQTERGAADTRRRYCNVMKVWGANHG